MISTLTRATINVIRKRALRQPPQAAARFFHTSSPKMTVHIIATMEEFKETIAKHPVVLLDAFATWCGPCKAIAPKIAEWSQQDRFKGKIHFAKFDVDHLPELSTQLGITAMPTIKFFKDGKMLDKEDTVVGANIPVIEGLLVKHAPADTEEKDV